MTLKNRLRALESRLPRQRFHDMSHLTDRQLELIESCVDSKGWDRDQISRLSQGDANDLLAALQSLSPSAYHEVRDHFSIPVAPATQARITGLMADAKQSIRPDKYDDLVKRWGLPSSIADLADANAASAG